MSDFGIKRNASGYYDETAYKAITKGPKPGEIWTHRTIDDYVLVLARDERVCSMLKLDDKFREGKIVVRARAQMYTDPLKLSYCFHDQLGAYVKTLPDKEFVGVKKIVAETLGITKAVIGG